MPKKFISGIVVAKNLDLYKFQFDLCLKAWSRACDEIVVVTDKKIPSDLGIIWRDRDIVQDPRCPIKARAIEAPENFELYRFAGYLFCSKPHYVIHFDADYLISPDDALLLRKTIEEAPEDNDIITYRLIYLNYGGTHLYTDSMIKTYVTPYDGYSGNYPFVLNVRRQNFISPGDAYEERNSNRINFESVVNLGENWGGAYDQKFNRWSLNQQGRVLDPRGDCGFNLLDSGAAVEHLTWSTSDEVRLKKLADPYWAGRGVTDAVVKGGDIVYEKKYEELAIFRERMRK
jgi:hypothetical protein